MEIPIQYINTVSEILNVFEHAKRVVFQDLTMLIYVVDIRTMRVMTLRIFQTCTYSGYLYEWDAHGKDMVKNMNRIAGFEQYALKTIISTLGLDCQLRSYYYVREMSDIDSYLRQVIAPEAIDNDIYNKCLQKIEAALNDPVMKRFCSMQYFKHNFIDQGKTASISAMLNALADDESIPVISLMPTEEQRFIVQSYKKYRSANDVCFDSTK